MCERSGVKVRKFEGSDLDVVRDLIHITIDACYPEHYCAEAVQFFKDWHYDEKILKNAAEGYTIVLEQNGRIVGTGTLIGNEIVRVFIDPAFQKSGFGKLVMQKLEENALSKGINIVKLDASLPSKVFYDLLGYVTLEETFIEVGDNKRLDYYKMRKILA
ncbi:MAG: GNAT family N-acetyltransferase [Sedimentisphaerales bacterium]|nr:GNAT family N-acetyltransferase [Sedimentisphaerales bacterium]